MDEAELDSQAARERDTHTHTHVGRDVNNFGGEVRRSR